MSGLILLTGATGYVGGRLLSLLQQRGMQVCCLTRRPEALREPIDFWRVEGFEPNRRLRLHAEMKLPGRAWLEFEVSPCEQGSTIRQTAIFDPLGLAGLVYWYGIYPLHQFVFAGMLRNLARAAESSHRDSASTRGIQTEATAPEGHSSGSQL